MAVVVSTVGTDSRDYATWSLFEADLDNSSKYNAGDEAVGVGYNDSVFIDRIIVNGGVSLGLASVKLTVEENSRHAGSAGTGLIVQGTGIGFSVIELTRNNVTVEWFEAYSVPNTSSVNLVILSSDSFLIIIRNNIIHYSRTITEISRRYYGIVVAQLPVYPDVTYVLNNIIYSIYNPAETDPVFTGKGIQVGSGSIPTYIENNTIFDCGLGIEKVDGSLIFYNNIAVGSHVGGDFVNIPEGDYSLASDSTAAGTHSLNNKLPTDQFVSIVQGAEILLLKENADAIDAGLDLGTSVGVEIDILGRDRDLEGDIWDIGAHQYSTAPPPPDDDIVDGYGAGFFSSASWGDAKF